MADEQQVTINFSINQLNLVLAALAKLPLEAVLDTFQNIQQQANQQLGAPNTPSGPLADKVIK